MDAELKNQYNEMSIEPKQEVVDKSLELCLEYHISDAAEFVEQWVAFSLSHLHDAEPNMDNLAEFERKVLQAKREKEFVAASKKKIKYSAGISSLSLINEPAPASSSTEGGGGNPLAMYGVDMDDYMGGVMLAATGAGGAEKVGMASDDVLNSYVPHTPKAKSTLARTPAHHNDALFSPASYSPISGRGNIGTPRSHTAAPGSGKIVYTFGNPTIIGAAQWTALQPQSRVHVKQLLLHDGKVLSAANSKYMFDNLREKSEIAGDRVFQIGKSLCRKVFGADAKDFELSQVDVHSQDTIKTIGTIFCDRDGPLDPYSTLLVGSDEMRLRTVRLQFSKIKYVGVFPGQVVLLSGMNPKGDIFTVEDLITEQVLDAPPPPKFADQLSFVIAAGPYTHDDDLVYDPLNDLMAYLKDHKPDVLILTGPFLEADHKLISENVTLADTFEAFFEKMIAGIVDVVGTSTTVLLVTSHRDANADPVYPTMPFTLKKTYPNVHLMPDPSMIDLNGIVIGMTSTDIVDHLFTHELAVNGGDKVKRIVNYLLHQASFYPLHPPPEDKMCFDSFLASKFANISKVPHILILPSVQKCFIRVVNGCLAINPGRLTDIGGGTFARFIITPPAPKDENNLFNFVGCQVRKV